MKISKKLAMVLALGMAVTFTAQIPVAVAAGISVDGVGIVGSSGDIDWMDSHLITAVGVGIPPQGVTAGATALARRAALVDAQRALAETVFGVQIDSETTVEMLAVQSDVIRSRVNAVVKGFRVISEGANPDGSYYVQVGIPLYGNGSLGAVVIPELKSKQPPAPVQKVDITTTKITQVEVTSIKATGYTGLVINAKDMDLSPTFSPVIFDEDNNPIYGIKNIDADFAIANGMVSYSSDPELAQNDARVGSNPLVVNAVSVRGGAGSVNRVNVVVSRDDADRILLANEGQGFLEKCSVVFVR